MNAVARRQSSRATQPLGQRAVPSFRTRFPPTSRRVVAAQASGMPVKDRVLSSLPYLIPMCDGLKYGKFLMVQYPIFATVLAPLSPFARLYFSVPFFPLIVFFAVYLGIVNNQSLDRSVRYNAMQAILLDIILIIPSLLESTLRPSFGSGPFLQAYITGYNTLFLFVLSAVVYGVGSCAAGQIPRIPLVSEAAEQVR
eukprot:jgi/Ulvmu1/8022/UM004_0259.1